MKGRRGSAVKTALAVCERGRDAAAEFGETASDIIAEAQAEFADERRAKLGSDMSGRPLPARLQGTVAAA